MRILPCLMQHAPQSWCLCSCSRPTLRLVRLLLSAQCSEYLEAVEKIDRLRDRAYGGLLTFADSSIRECQGGPPTFAPPIKNPSLLTTVPWMKTETEAERERESE